MNLKDLKVKSFVTNLEHGNSETVKGGLAPVGGNKTVPVTVHLQCASQLGLISDCCPSEYRTACESGNIICYEEKEPEKYKM